MEPSPLRQDIPQKIEELVRQADAIPDPRTRALAIDLVSAVMELHGAALHRIVELARSPEHTSNLTDAMAADDFVSAVLAMHDLHPHEAAERIKRSAEKVRQELRPGSMDLELKEVTDRRVRVRLIGGKPAARAAARHWIQSALYEAAPEIEEIVIEGVEDHSEFVPIESLLASREAM